MDPLAVAVLFLGLLAASLVVTLVVRLGTGLLARWLTAASRLEPPLEALARRERTPRAGGTADQ